MKLLIFFIITIFSFANTKIAVCGNLENVLKKINNKYHLKAQIYTGSSGELASDLLWQPNRYDIFISANKKYIDNLMKYNICKKSKILTYATILLISKKIKLHSLNDLINAKKIVIANPDYAPFGKISKKILIKTNLFNKIKDKLILKNNVAEVNKNILAHPNWIGISSNSAILLKVHYIHILIKYYKPLPQTICLVNKKGEKIYNFLVSPTIKNLLKKYGYIYEY